MYLIIDDYPDAAKSKPKLGSITKPNQEAVIATNANIVFTRCFYEMPDTVEKLRALNINVL